VTAIDGHEEEEESGGEEDSEEEFEDVGEPTVIHSSVVADDSRNLDAGFYTVDLYDEIEDEKYSVSD